MPLPRRAAFCCALSSFFLFAGVDSVSGDGGDRPPVLRLGGFFPFSGPWTGGISVAPAVMLALDDINNDTSILNGTLLQVACVTPGIPCPVSDTQCNAQAGLLALLASHQTYSGKTAGSDDPPLVGLLGGGCSGVCESMQSDERGIPYEQK